MFVNGIEIWVFIFLVKRVVDDFFFLNIFKKMYVGYVRLIIIGDIIVLMVE